MNIASQISIPNNTLTVPELTDSFVDPDHKDEDAWTRINDRRVALIIKQSDEGLSPSECGMLDKLQAAMMRHNDVIAPPPWQLIEENVAHDFCLHLQYITKLSVSPTRG